MRGRSSKWPEPVNYRYTKTRSFGLGFLSADVAPKFELLRWLTSAAALAPAPAIKKDFL